MSNINRNSKLPVSVMENINTPFFGMSGDHPQNTAGVLGFLDYLGGVDITANELNDLRVSFGDKLRDCLIIIESKQLKSQQMISWGYMRNDKVIIERILNDFKRRGIDNAISQFLDNLRNDAIVKVEDKNILKQLIDDPLLKEYDRKTFSKIYKWIGFEKDLEKKISTIIEGKIYCSSPTKVNDLLDCQIAIADCELTQFSSKITSGFKDIEFNINRAKLILKTFSRVIQFYSCSKQSYDNIAITNMWGQYADYGNGICLEYDINDLFINYMTTNIKSFVFQSNIENFLASNRVGKTNRYNIRGNNVNYKRAKKTLEQLYPRQIPSFCANEIEYSEPREFVQKRSHLVFTYFTSILKSEPIEKELLLDLFDNYYRYKTLNWQHEEEVRFSMVPYYINDTLMQRFGEIDKTSLTNRNIEQAEIEYNSLFKEYEDSEDNNKHNFIKPSTIVFGHKVVQDKINEVQNKINDPKIKYMKLTGAIMTNEAKLEVRPLN